jgi:hypothetical protein
MIQIFDHNRMETIRSIVGGINKTFSVSGILECVLSKVPDVVNCSSGQLIVFNKQLIGAKDSGSLTLQKTMVEGLFFDMVAVNQESLSYPAFNSLAEASSSILNTQYLSLPIFDENNQLLAAFQVQSKPKNQVATLDKSAPRRRGSIVYQGFALIDTHVMNLLAEILMMKLSSLMAVKLKKEAKDEMLSAIKLAGDICTQRSQTQMIRTIKEKLPDYFGFEGVGVIIRDMKTDLFFTVNEIMEEKNKKVGERDYDEAINIIQPT